MNNDILAISLEEFGLSRYESRAYVTLLKKGPLSASELAYYSDVPRAKVYSTLSKLTKKGLASTVQGKPLVFSAISPDEAFSEFLLAQEARVTGLRATVSSLKKVTESNLPYGAEERKYFTLDPKGVLIYLKRLVTDAEHNFDCVLDSWGLRIMEECKDELTSAEDLHVRILLSNQQIVRRVAPWLTSKSHVRIACLEANIFMSESSVLVIDSTNGRGELLYSSGMLNQMYSRIFNFVWEKSVPLSQERPIGSLSGNHRMTQQHIDNRKRDL